MKLHQVKDQSSLSRNIESNSIVNTTYHTLTLARIAWAQAEIGVVEEAKKTIAQALVTSKKIKGAYERNSAIDSIDKVLANMK